MTSALSEAERLLAEGLRLASEDEPLAALDCYRQARVIFEDVSNSERVAACDQRAAMAYSDLRQLDRAIDLSQSALDFYTRSGNEVAVAKIRVNLSAALIRGWRYADALTQAELALPVFVDLGLPVEEGTCRQNIGIALRGLERFDEAIVQQETAGVLFRSAPEGHGASYTPAPAVRAAESDVNLGLLLSIRGRHDEAMEKLDRAEAFFVANDRPVRAAVVRSSRASAFGRLGRYADAWASARQASSDFVALGQPMRAAACSVMAARALLHLDRAEDAAAIASLAVTELEGGRHALRRATLRASWYTHYLGLYEVACESATRTGRPGLTAALIELARTQSIPAPSSVGDVGPTLPPEPRPVEGQANLREVDRDRSAALAAIGELPLGRPSGIAAGSDRIEFGGSLTLDIGQLAKRVGGENAWWWGTLATRDRLWWSIIAPEGAVHTGHVELGPSSTLGRLLAMLQRSVPQAGADKAPLSSQLASSVFAEPIDRAHGYWARLGKAILPPPLATALRLANPRRPLSLVLAPSPVLARVPVALLTVPGTAAPVIDRAVIRTVPSAAVLGSLKRRAANTPRRDLPLVLAVIDPTSDLPNARRFRIKAESRLVGGAATTHAVAQRMRSLPAGYPGVVMFACHIAQEIDDVSSSAGIQLADGTLSAKEILLATDRLNSPERVLLAGCTSVGHVGGEWLALGPALLYAGARQVVATLWPVIDDRHAVRFDRATTRTIRAAEDPAVGMRRLQRSELRKRWRGGKDVPLAYRWGGLITITS